MWLVRYGRSAFVGAFAAERPFVRGDRVLIDSPRGRELGEVLGAASDSEPDGRIVRPAEASDIPFDAAPLLDAAVRSIEPRGALVLDCEILLDGAALLHVVAWEPVNLDAALAELSASFGRPVRLLDISRSRVAADPTNCGKPNCGSGGCSSGGCGSCSRGSTTPDDLAHQFRELREAMERDAIAGRRELL